MSNNGLLTIKEAATIAKVHVSTIYNLINSNRIQVQFDSIRGKKTKKVRRLDIERIFRFSNLEENLETTRIEPETISNLIEKSINNYFETKRTALMKPIEEQALFRLGILENELKHLEAEKETLRIENETLRNQNKILPELQDKEKVIAELEQSLKQSEEEKKQIAEAWKKELEKAKKPWYKFW